MKKIILMLLAATFLCGLVPAYAEEETEQILIGSSLEEKEMETVYTLSLEDAKNLAYEDNQQINSVDIKRRSYDLSLDAARYNKGKSKNAVFNVTSSTISGVLVRKGYYVELFRSQSELAKKELEKVKANISYNVTEKYYNYKLTERLVEVCRTSSELAKTNLETVKKMYELGIAAKIDVDSADAVCKQAQSAAENYERALELAAEDLKIALNIEDPARFVLTDNIDFSEYESDVDKDIEAAMHTRYDVQGLYENARLSKMNYEIIGTALTEKAADTLTAKSSYVQAEYTAENSTKLIKLGIRSAYNNIVSAKSSMEIAKINTDINNQKYNAAKLKYEMGMITNSELTSILNDLRASEIEYEKARLSHKLAVEKYSYEITIGL